MIIYHNTLNLVFKDLIKTERHIINNYYYEYLNEFNELSNRIIHTNQWSFITGPGGNKKTTLLNLLQDKLKGQN